MTLLTDLIVMFPCFIPMRPGEGNPHPYTATTEHGEVAIPICTDHAILSEMFAAGANGGAFIMATTDTPKQLVSFLGDYFEHPTRNGAITHVIVDPKPGATTFQCYPIIDFCKHILN